MIPALHFPAISAHCRPVGQERIDVERWFPHQSTNIRTKEGVQSLQVLQYKLVTCIQFDAWFSIDTLDL